MNGRDDAGARLCQRLPVGGPERRVFRYAGTNSSSFTLAGTVFFQSMVASVIYLGLQRGMADWTFFLLPGFGSVFFAVIGALALLGSSDVVLSGRGISWALFGKEWRYMAWTDISYICAYSKRDFGRVRSSLAFAIVPSRRIGFLGRGGSGFDEHIGDFESLRSLLGLYVVPNRIRVCVRKGGTTTDTVVLPSSVDVL